MEQLLSGALRSSAPSPSLINIWAMQASGLRRGLSSRPMNQGAEARVRGAGPPPPPSSKLPLRISSCQSKKVGSKLSVDFEIVLLGQVNFAFVIVSIWEGQTGAIRT